MGRTLRPLQLEMEMPQRRQNAGGKGLPNSKSLMLQWKTTSPFTTSSTTFQSSIFSRMAWCPSLANTAGKDGEGCGCHGDRWTWYAGVFMDGSDWSALQLFMAVTQHPWWVPTWYWPRCVLPFAGKHSQRPEKFWFWLWFAPEPYDQRKYELSLGIVLSLSYRGDAQCWRGYTELGKVLPWWWKYKLVTFLEGSLEVHTKSLKCLTKIRIRKWF